MSKINSLKGKTSSVAMLALLTAASLSSFSLPVSAVTDPVVFTFSTVGDTRQDPASPDPTTLLPPPPATGGALLPQDAQWLQNTRVWARVMRTVQSQKANLLFVNGDMIMGYGRAAVPSAWSTTPPATTNAVVNSDLVRFYTQYAYWRGMVANSLETGTYIVPVPGNHETQCSTKVTTNGTYNFGATPIASGCMKNPDGSTGKFAYVENENAWRANMGDLIGDLSANVRFQTVVGVPALSVKGLISTEAPTSATDPGITTDQSELSYSFDINTAAGRLHFAVVNTDATGFDSKAPTGWLSADLAAAQGRGVVKYFVFGHKPAFTYNYLQSPGTVPAAGLDVDKAARADFWNLIVQYKATYFCGHEHSFKIDSHANVDPSGNEILGAIPSYHVLVGTGGSPFDAKTTDVLENPHARYYAWATVRVHQSGNVTLDAYGFDTGFGPTQLIQSIGSLQ